MDKPFTEPAIPFPKDKGTCIAKLHPRLTWIRSVLAKQPDADAVYENLLITIWSSTFSPPERAMVLALAAKEAGDRKLSATTPSYHGAMQNFLAGASHLIEYRASSDIKMDSPTFRCSTIKIYGAFTRESDPGADLFFLHLVFFLSSIGYCYMKLDDTFQAIEWLQEVDLLFKLHFERITTSGNPWERSYPLRVADFVMVYGTYQTYLSDVFKKLGNTATAAHMERSSKVSTTFVPKFGDKSKKHHDQDTDRFSELTTVRHPDFKNAANAEVVDPELQLKGSWTRIFAKKGRRPKNRAGFSSWIWKSRLYICGGKNYTKLEYLSSFWCLDLVTMKSWRQLPHSPMGNLKCLSAISDLKMCVWKDDAWLFYGQTLVLKFNLVAEKWIYVETKWDSKERWPYTAGSATEFCAEIFEGVLHIFGGGNGFESAGCNLHMALDLQTLRWTKIGGTVKLKKLIRGMPLMRKGAGSWVVPEERRMYILYGCASPQHVTPTREGPEYQHDDMWSYSFDEKVWRREVIRGNFPSPRSRFACTYDARLQQLIVFGGGHVQMPSHDQHYSQKIVDCTPLGDTFVLDLITRTWKQVLTSNFPHHRMCTQAHVDDDTGRIYLYGGMCPSEFMPSKHARLKCGDISLGDMWELDIDFSDERLIETSGALEEPPNKFGPWKLCFECGQYKTDMFACGGTCGGRIYLCSTDCQKKCWGRHKQLHFCRRF